MSDGRGSNMVSAGRATRETDVSHDATDAPAGNKDSRALAPAEIELGEKFLVGGDVGRVCSIPKLTRDVCVRLEQPVRWARHN
jgi:hypothetical protein